MGRTEYEQQVSVCQRRVYPTPPIQSTLFPFLSSYLAHQATTTPSPPPLPACLVQTIQFNIPKVARDVFRGRHIFYRAPQCVSSAPPFPLVHT
ncbi:hypothetical protein PoB_007058000 [Plakobranchus ocellatus]|uniref:Uncharacterized protein n=1 Tax=Plakobranchus ocellatus TaxID=259542 RepID=A0AAV4DJB6_9GAST|nr:hypothetical protein PoB_007058000 [Plakobranchus ocellatus]